MNPLIGTDRVILRYINRCSMTLMVIFAMSVAASAQQFAIGSYHLQKSVRTSITQYDYTYTVDVTNHAALAQNILGTVTSSSPDTIVRKGSVAFGAVPAGGTVTSTDTFIIRQDRRVPFNPSSLTWTFPAPQAPSATNIVIPSSDAANEASSASYDPYSQSSMRYQQVYSASQFSKSGLISEISFRPDGSLGTGTGVPQPLMPTPLSIKVILSTTNKEPGSLSTTFTQNLGLDNTVVYDSTVNGPWSFSTSYAGTAPGPNAFDVRLRLPVPFPYNPSEGNLLVDITITSGASGMPELDADDSQSGTMSSIYAPSATAMSATVTQAAGLVTQFTFGSFAVANNCSAVHNQLAWIIFGNNLALLTASLQNSNPTLTAQAFNNPCALLGGSPTIGSANSQPVPAGWSSLALASIDSFQNFRNDLLTNTMAPGYKVVLYDNETWAGKTLTPTIEKSSPRQYEALFANLAHAYGYAFMSAPGTDLVTVQTSPIAFVPGQPIYPQYITMGFPAFSAQAPADIYDIQAQGSQATEGNTLNSNPACTALYCSFLASAVPIANQANPATVVITGVSTNPNSINATEYQMENAVNDTKSYVSGYWFNIPNATTVGQNPFPLAGAFLNDLNAEGLLGTQ